MKLKTTTFNGQQIIIIPQSFSFARYAPAPEPNPKSQIQNPQSP